MSALNGPVGIVPVSDSLQRDTSAKATVGTHVVTEDGEFVYVTATNGITTSGDPVSLNASGLGRVRRGVTTAGAFLGIAEAPFVSGESGFIRTKGPATTVVLSGALTGDALELSATAGALQKYSAGVPVAILLAATSKAAGSVSIYLT